MSDSRDITVDPGAAAARASAGSQWTQTSEGLARIAAAVEAQRAEIYTRSGDAVRLTGWWAALGHEVEPPDADRPVDPEWFPWTLGNIRQARHVFVRNAGPLPLRPDHEHRIRDLGMGSALYLPVLDGLGCIGAVCVYWVLERDTWPSEQAGRLTDLARDTLLAP
jgi:hypothetical protein